MSVDAEGGTERGRSLTVRLATNTIVQAAGILAGAAIGFFTFVAVTRGLGPEAFGDFTAAMVFLFIPVVIADIGFSTAVLREISASPERTESAMRASLPFRTFVSAGIVALAAAIGVLLPLNDRTTVAILIGAVGSFLTLMTLALLPVLQAQLRMHWAVAGNVTGRLVTLGLTLAALGIGLGFKSIVAAQVVGIAVTFAVHLYAVGRTVRLRPVVDPQYWRSLVAGSIVIGLAIGLSQIYFRVDTVLLALFRSSEEVGLYGAAYKFIELSQFMAAAVAVSMFPPLAAFVARGDPRARDLVQKSFDVLIAGAVFLFVLMLAFPEEIITVSAGPDYREAASALQLLAPYVLFGFVNAGLWRALLATERDRLLLATAVVVLVLNVALNLALIPEYGYKAAAVISVVSEAVILAPIAWAVRQDGLLPNLRYGRLVVVAGLAMAAVAWGVPAPAIVAGTLATALYAAILLAAPGTVNEVARSLLPALRRRSAAT
ncbi:MAG TPA: flippase [Gaiellaceae bacterium]|nr:flippase [Gaiellaceae bacterium]